MVVVLIVVTGLELAREKNITKTHLLAFGRMPEQKLAISAAFSKVQLADGGPNEFPMTLEVQGRKVVGGVHPGHVEP